MKKRDRQETPLPSSPLRSSPRNSPRSKIVKADDEKALEAARVLVSHVAAADDVKVEDNKPPLVDSEKKLTYRRQSGRSHPSFQRLLMGIDTLPTPTLSSSSSLIPPVPSLVLASTVRKQPNINFAFKPENEAQQTTSKTLLLSPKTPFSSPRAISSPAVPSSTYRAIYAATREAIAYASETEKQTQVAYNEALARLSDRAFLAHKDSIDIDISPKKEEEEEEEENGLSRESFPSIVRKSSHNLILSGSSSMIEIVNPSVQENDDDNDDDDDDDNDNDERIFVDSLARKEGSTLKPCRSIDDSAINLASNRSMKAFERITVDPTNLESIAEYQKACEALNQALKLATS